MDAMSRRAVLMNVLPGAAIAIAGVGTIGWAVAPDVADAMPLGAAKGAHAEVDDLVVKADVVYPGELQGMSPPDAAQWSLDLVR